MPQVYLNPTGNREQALYICETIADLRNQLPPSYKGNVALTATDRTAQLALAFVLGGASFLDGLGGSYAWDALSAAADNNSTVIRPNNFSVGGQMGRWRLYQTL